MTEPADFVIAAATALNLLLTCRLISLLRPVLGQASGAAAVPSPELGSKAPPYETERLDVAARLSWRDLDGSDVLYLFMSHTCSSCRRHLATLGPVVERCRAAGEVPVLVVIDDTSRSRDLTLEVLSELREPPMTVLALPEDPLLTAYNPRQATPYFIQVRAGRVTRKGGVGSPEWSALVAGWTAKVATAQTPGAS